MEGWGGELEVDAATEEAIALMRERRCSFRLVVFFPGPGNRPRGYPIEVSAPDGFHLADGQHSFVCREWAGIAERLASGPLLRCDEDCGE